MQFRIAVALLLALAVAAGIGTAPASGGVIGEADSQVVAARETQRALTARFACRVSLDCASALGGLVADVSPDDPVGQGRGLALEPAALASLHPAAARLVARTRGPPRPRT